MRILLCAATEMEIAPTIQALLLRDRHKVNFLITGVGLMACTYALTREVVANRPDLVIQAGVAGSLLPESNLAQVVVVKSECVGDIGVKEDNQFLSLFDLKLLSPDTLPWQNKKLINENDVVHQTAFPIVDGVTVNEISTTGEQIAYYRNELNVQVESMEGAALHYIGLLEKIPFLQIRSLSNFIGERDKSKWKMKEAVSALNRELQNILMKLEAI